MTQPLRTSGRLFVSFPSRQRFLKQCHIYKCVDGLRRRRGRNLKQQAAYGAPTIRSTVRTDRIRARKTLAWTVASASASERRVRELRNRPSSGTLKTPAGMAPRGRRWVQGFNIPGQGTGLQTNEAHRIRPRSLGGACAANETATGPENDSPRITNSSSAGSSARARPTRSS